MSENLSPAMRTALNGTVSRMLAYGKAPHIAELRVFGAGRTIAALQRRGLVDSTWLITPEGCDMIDETGVAGYMVKYFHLNVDAATAREQVACPDADGTPINAGMTVEFRSALGFRSVMDGKAAKVISVEPGAPGAPARMTIDMIEVDDPKTGTTVTRGRPYAALANRFRVRPAAAPAPAAPVVDVDGAPITRGAVVECVGEPGQIMNGETGVVVEIQPGANPGVVLRLSSARTGSGRHARGAGRVRVLPAGLGAQDALSRFERQGPELASLEDLKAVRDNQNAPGDWRTQARSEIARRGAERNAAACKAAVAPTPAAPAATVDVDGAPLEECAVVELVYGDGSPSQLGSLALVVALGPNGSTEGPLVTLTDVAWGGRYTRLASLVRRVAMYTLWEDADEQVSRSRETYAVKGAPGAYRLVVTGGDAELRREDGEPSAPGKIDPWCVMARIFATVDGTIITTGHRFGPRRMVAAGEDLFVEV